MTASTVQVVPCVDTEGPLFEPLMATFTRLHETFGVDLEPTTGNLSRLQRGEIPLGGQEAAVARMVDAQLLAYNDSWDKIDAMLREIMAPAFRSTLRDSFGGGWIYNWHCLDHVGFEGNPRRRDLGFHHIFDHYRNMIEETGSHEDRIHFHHHPVPFSRDAHRPATHYFARTPIIFEILARRIIDRLWFPTVNRPGFHTTRPDSNWFMEQFIPFDYANQSGKDVGDQKDLADGRFGDWRRAPKSWAPYHPTHDDYQAPGSCRRWIARCLNVGTRIRLLNQADVDQAFAEARDGHPVVLAFTNHDFRDMRPDIALVQSLLERSGARFPEVRFRYTEARHAMRSALALTPSAPIEISLTLTGNRLSVSTSRETFGPQPFFALKSKSGDYLHDNMDFQEPRRRWTYTFDENTVPMSALDTVGVATSDENGHASVVALNVKTGQTRHASH